MRFYERVEAFGSYLAPSENVTIDGRAILTLVSDATASWLGVFDYSGAGIIAVS